MIVQPRRADRHGARGFSAMEILVVIAIIGFLTLVTVPMFLNYQRRNALRIATRSFVTVLRACRQEAIGNNRMVRLTAILPPGEKFPREYQTFSSTDNGTNWNEWNRVNGISNRAWLEETIFFDSVTFPNSRVEFRQDGTVTTTGAFALKTDWKDIINQATVSVSAAGQISVTEAKVP